MNIIGWERKNGNNKDITAVVCASPPPPNDKAMFSSFAYNDEDNNADDVLGLIIEFTIYVHTTWRLLCYSNTVNRQNVFRFYLLEASNSYT